MIDFSILTGSAFLQAFLLMVLAAYSQYVVLRAGVYSVATVGFMAIGAYTTAIATTRYHMPAIAAVLLSIVLTVVVGAIVGRLIEKLRGAYQAIATLAFVIIVQLVIFMWNSFTGGFFGIIGIPFWADETVLWILAAVVLVAVVGVELTSLGRRQRASFHDEVAAAACGVDVARTKLWAVMISAGLGGLAGAANAGNQLAVDTSLYGFSLVIVVLSAVVIGGSRSFLGPIVGAYVATALPLLLKEYATFSGMAVAIVTILIMILLPRGVTSPIPVDAAWLHRKLRRRARSGSGDAHVIKAGDGIARHLVAENVTRHYGAVKAVSGVSFDVETGKVVGLIGPNGAGKTTVMNLVAGLAKLDSGTITLGGTPIDTLPSFRIARLGIGRTFQTCRLIAESTVWENVLLAAASGRSRSQRRRVSDRERVWGALEMAGCLDIADRIATDLPYTFQRRVEIARALATEPGLVLLDEPAAGMPESEAEQLAVIVGAIAASGIGVLVIDHNVGWICSISDYVLVQNFGVTIAAGAPGTIVDNPAVIDAYLGAAEDRGDPQPAGVE
ncbi:branched-chain amino acid ABC transporter ATP-binding protein/permease [Amycolatopsis sp. K13G38]|uniref:Branched-chain amino acid ABC transporter ATP-binding protein/permease n=1 Tax=Amycolatopsis acididurans TaxID=2724524 RepID=A0ABX1J8N0_9PSEU|nr:branched-chain amino acid ABC transporter ATP-binding protein/permease [Amycolatopsis acididurans]NKQ56160.1 branched-chain amino acid ABC transporter ATP-binding protein/permease [Amycolatopsis acididurans]